MDTINSAIKSVRSLKSLLPPKVRPAAIVHCHTNEAHGIIKGHEMEIVTLAKLSSLTVCNYYSFLPHFIYLFLSITVLPFT